jgi:hypothetical protein
LSKLSNADVDDDDDTEEATGDTSASSLFGWLVSSFSIPA